MLFSGAATSLSLLNVVTMATGPDGSIFVGDYNLIRKIDPQGNVLTILQFRWVLHCYMGLTQVVNLVTNTIWTATANLAVCLLAQDSYGFYDE